MEKALKLYTYIDGVSTPFPNAEHQIEITSFNYDAKRMGGAPTISATVMFPTCLDNDWKEEVYAEFNGEKYFLKQTPTSSKSNTDARWKHDLELVSERIALDNVYFYDTVIGKPDGDDKPVSNSSTFTFFGTIKEFAARLNASLIYSGLEYRVFDVSIDSEEKLMSFDNQPFSVAIQEAYNQYQIPYYFVGKTIYFDFFEHALPSTFKYGAGKELLSITKSNANQKVITRCTGVGGSENIPYYYPNAHPQGEIKPVYKRNGAEQEDVVMVVDDALFAKKILLTDDLTYTSYIETIVSGLKIESYQIKDFNAYKNTVTRQALINSGTVTETNWFLAPNQNWSDSTKVQYSTELLGHYESVYDNTKTYNVSNDNNAIAFRITFDEKYFIPNPANNATISERTFKFTIKDLPKGVFGDTIKFVRRGGYSGLEVEDTYYRVTKHSDGTTWSGEFAIHEQWFADVLNYDKAIYLVFKIDAADRGGKTFTPKVNIEFKSPTPHYGWEKNSEHYVDLYDLGLSNVLSPQLNDTITFKQVSYVQPMPNLMPPIYWESNGEERFYNAENSKYVDPETNKFYVFKNPYKPSKRIEHIVDFPDIKPTIANIVNAKEDGKQPINVFTAFDYDKDDNDEVDANGNYIHPYFYGKLRKFSGENGFNIFTHASEKGDVTFSMTSGNCGACNFVLGVDSETGKNKVQVNDDGTLKRDKNGNVLLVGTPQDRQNDTQNNEVWVALKKDTSTFGHIMPSAQHNYKPSAGDTFVLLNINMPIQYVTAAEEKLKQEIVKYMYENNEEKFTFSIKFSRIYFAENENILRQLNENALINIEYNSVEYALYVNSFSYKMNNNEPLPEITVELAKTLTTSQNAIQSAISEVKTDILDKVQKMDVVAMVAAKFLSKDEEDYAKQKITFNRGLGIGTEDGDVANINELGEANLESAILKKYISSPSFVDGFTGNGFKMWLDENGLSHLTVDVLTARQRMVIYEMLISKIRSVNGALWVTAANGTIAKVVDNGNNYEITFNETNTFVAGDYMRCQVFNGAGMRSYWVVVSSVDGNRVYVDKSEFDDTMPLVGDDVVLCGSRVIGRQNAIHISATNDGQPRIDILDGIKSKSLDGCLRTRLGNLDGIIDSAFGDKQPRGDGLYGDNVFLKGEFILKNTGKNVETVFEIQDGKIKGGIAQTQSEAIRGKSYLYNASFIKGLDGWLTSNEENVYFSGDALLFDSSSLLYQSVSISSEPIFENVFFVTINNGWIKQSNMYFVNKPEFDAEKQYPLNFSCNMRCAVAGILIVKVGDNVLFEKEMRPSEEFVMIDVEELAWNGEGDFYLSFSGRADFYGLTIFTEKTEVRHKTFFDMSDRLINFGAQQLDEKGNIKKESGIVVQPDSAGLYARDENGNQAKIATYADGIVVLEGEQIQLKGNLTTDGNFKVREDGSIEANNGAFNGYLIALPIKITRDNYMNFFDEPYNGAWYSTKPILSECVILQYTSAEHNDNTALGTKFFLPSISFRDIETSNDVLDLVRSFIGKTITIYNNTQDNRVQVEYYGNDPRGDKKDFTFKPNGFASFVCKLTAMKYETGDEEYKEYVYWENVSEGIMRTYNNN